MSCDHQFVQRDGILNTRVCTKCGERRERGEDGAWRVERNRRLWALVAAVRPFAEIMLGSSGRIPTERLSAAHWHALTRAFTDVEVNEPNPEFQCCGAADAPCPTFDESCKNPANYE